jgi:hypothetical protein
MMMTSSVSGTPDSHIRPRKSSYPGGKATLPVWMKLETGVVVGSYLIVSLTLNATFEQYQISQSKAFPIVFTLVVILLFNPLRNRVQSLNTVISNR